MYGLYISGLASRLITVLLVVIILCASGVTSSDAGMLVAEGKHSRYIADQDSGIVYVVYGDGEWVRFSDGFGHISGFCAAPKNAFYVLSASQHRLYRISAQGEVKDVMKVGSSPQAIFVDRDGLVKFVQRAGVITGVH
ncbi:hypothetical protein [Maridesulfovibrio sp.]|uniref:hypothetical protein n=1 Tax=Maridesulfovibrio sp. TaxID=2795000 RepID=UPI0029F49594|nr:hypothetical protein [Maridesulfovibrio sp.]